MSEENNPFKTAYQREKHARREAEQLLEDKSRELYLKNRELEASYEQLKAQQALMLKNEKMATLGTLSAGMAHEVNNPLAFVVSNIKTLQEYIAAYLRLQKLIYKWVDEKKLPAPHIKVLQELAEREDFEYLIEDIPSLLNETADGANRVKEIVTNLRSFSRTQQSDRVETDLTEGIRSTLKLINSRFGENIQLKLDLQPIPAVICNSNEINQVFMNLIINAEQAIDGAGMIAIKCFAEKDQVVVTISDTGAGIPEEIQKDIFTPFFTTKPPGKGTGMGLAVVHGIIEEHGGTISLKSVPGKGTRFEIRLPQESAATTGGSSSASAVSA